MTWSWRKKILCHIIIHRRFLRISILQWKTMPGPILQTRTPSSRSKISRPRNSKMVILFGLLIQLTRVSKRPRSKLDLKATHMLRSSIQTLSRIKSRLVSLESQMWRETEIKWKNPVKAFILQTGATILPNQVLTIYWPTVIYMHINW
jgi:hypothetical protein